MTPRVSVSIDLFRRKALRQALRKWDSSQALGEHPLALLQIVDQRRAAAGYRPTVLGRGVALRDVLQSAIRRLRPNEEAEDYYDKRWRPFLILQQQYLLSRGPDYLAAQMGIERSTYDHSQVEALESLARVLREWEQIGLPSDAGLFPAGLPQERLEAAFNAPPRSSHPLVDRGGVLDDLRSRLTDRDSPRAVALTGIPGVGKTAVAAELAHDASIRESFQEGILWAGLGVQPNLSGQLSLWAVALGLGLEELPQFPDLETKAQAIHAAIGQRRLLLVIDDVWHSEHGLALKIGGPACAHLFTTRFPRVAAEIAGDRVLPIHELSVESGLLLLNRLVPALASVDPGVAKGLVELVGGLPLGLVLIGGFLQREASAGQAGRFDRALARLRETGAWLQIAQATSPLEGQPSLEAKAPLSLDRVIGLSVQSLDPDARSVLRAIAYLPPKPNTVSEEALLRCSGRHVESIDSLVDHGLLETVGPMRYGLHRAIAEHMRLQPPDEAMEERLIQYYVSWIGTVGGEAQEIGPEAHNIQVALRLARGRGLHSALAAGIDAFFPYLEMVGWVELAERLLAWGEAAARASGEPRLLWRTLSHKGRFAQRRGDFPEAERSFREALQMALESGDTDAQCGALTGLAVIALSRGDFAAAEIDLEKALRLADGAGSWRHAGAILSNLGSLALNRGNTEDAERRMYAGLKLARAARDHPTIRALLTNLGVASARRGNLALAEERFQESLELAHASGSRRDMAFLLTNLGALASDRGEVDRAWNYLNEAYDVATALDDRAQVSHLMASLGALALRRNDVEKAKDLIERGLAIALEIGHKECSILLLVNRAALRERLGDAHGADSDLIEALQAAEGAGLARYVCAAWIENGELALRRGALTEARTSYDRAKIQARDIGENAMEARALFGLAQVAAGQASPEAAEELAAQSLSIYQKLGSYRQQEVQQFLEERRR